MKNFILILFLSIPLFLNAQTEVGLLAGFSAYQGELAPETSKASFSQTHAAFGPFIRVGVSAHLTLRGHFFYGKVSGDDANANSQARVDRNLSFRSRIYETGIIGEFNILGYRAYNLERVFSPYLFAGAALTKINPEAYYDNQWVELQPLGTEGQGLDGYEDKYKLWEIAIPMGIGVKYAINDQWNVGFEFGFRKTFTDYIDDISTVYVPYETLAAGNGELAAILSNRTGERTGSEPTVFAEGANRGDSSTDDWYIITGFTVSYNFSDNGLVGARRKTRRKGCY